MNSREFQFPVAFTLGAAGLAGWKIEFPVPVVSAVLLATGPTVLFRFLAIPLSGKGRAVQAPGVTNTHLQ